MFHHRFLAIQRSPYPILAITGLAYLGLGIIAAAIGPLLPHLADHNATSLAAAGTVFSAMAFGSLLAQLAGGPLVDRFGPRPILLAGVSLLATGSIGISMSQQLLVLLICASVAGVGHGSLDIANNTLVAATFARRNLSALNFLHVFFGIGSVLGPAVVSASMRGFSTGVPALWLGSGLLVGLVPAVFWLIPQGALKREHSVESRSPRAVYWSPLLWTFAVLLGLFVGAEVGVGAWTTTYVSQTTGLEAASAALVTSGFWLALTAGRLISAFLGGRLTPEAVLGIDLIGSVAGAIALLLTRGNMGLTVSSTLLIGLAFGSIYPTVVAIVSTRFKGRVGKATSIVVAAGSLGGMLLPPVQGLLLIGHGPQASIVFVTAGTAVMLFLYAALRLFGRRSRQGENQLATFPGRRSAL